MLKSTQLGLLAITLLGLSACSQPKKINDHHVFTAAEVKKDIQSSDFRDKYSTQDIVIEDKVQSVSADINKAILKMKANEPGQPESMLTVSVVADYARQILESPEYTSKSGTRIKLTCKLTNNPAYDLDSCMMLNE